MFMIENLENKEFLHCSAISQNQRRRLVGFASSSFSVHIFSHRRAPFTWMQGQCCPFALSVNIVIGIFQPILQ